ncbi:MAG: putative Fe-S cluster assembly protein SufT [Puniceicoccales bacterium]|jgi:probable FeS assembly SUF system protein SufT|nr:putative Fe-S cluster assembly protein SufT [Puniceicoccales bacterium]
MNAEFSEKVADVTASKQFAQSNDRTLSREVSATIIPSGDPMSLPAGTRVNIANRLGGNFTVVCDFGMFRINGADADSLGEQPPTDAPVAGQTDAYGSHGAAEHPGHSGPPDEAAVWEQLKTVFDPEIPVNIVDLGLVYSMHVRPIEGAADKHKVEVLMTLTAPGCGMGPVIAEDARNRVLTVPGVHEADVNIVWEPPWTSDMISEAGKMELGLL